MSSEVNTAWDIWLGLVSKQYHNNPTCLAVANHIHRRRHKDALTPMARTNVKHIASSSGLENESVSSAITAMTGDMMLARSSKQYMGANTDYYPTAPDTACEMLRVRPVSLAPLDIKGSGQSYPSGPGSSVNKGIVMNDFGVVDQETADFRSIEKSEAVCACINWKVQKGMSRPKAHHFCCWLHSQSGTEFNPYDPNWAP